MRKRTQYLAPALVAGILLFGAAQLAARPSSQSPMVSLASTPAPRSPSLLAAAGSGDPIPLAAEPSGVPAFSAIATGDAATTEPTAVLTATAEPAKTTTPAPSATPAPTQEPLPTPTAQSLPPDRITAPAINLDAKVVTVGWHDVADPNGGSHTEWDVASYAAGWHKNSAKPGQAGNVVLSGHNNIEGEVFRNLEKFQIGDPVTLSAGGRTFTYVVSDKFILLDKGVPYDERVKNAKWIGPFPDERLTLVSCWPSTNNTHRIFIIAKPAK